MVTQESRAKGAAVSCHPQYGRIATPLLKVRERERERFSGVGREGEREGGRPFAVFLCSGRTGELLSYWEYLRASVTEMALQYRDALARSEEGRYGRLPTTTNTASITLYAFRFC